MDSATKTPSTATYALLGLIAVKPWTGYELTRQAHRSLRYIWPTSEAHLYREQKRLVALGWAVAKADPVGRRPRTRYSITPQGRKAFRKWTATKPEPPRFEVEGIVRAFFGDLGTVDALAVSMRSTSVQARAMLDELLGFVDEYLDTGGPFPERLHVIALALEAVTELLATLDFTLQRSADDVERWNTTKARGLDAPTRARLERVRDRYRPAPASSPLP